MPLERFSEFLVRELPRGGGLATSGREDAKLSIAIAPLPEKSAFGGCFFFEQCLFYHYFAN